MTLYTNKYQIPFQIDENDFEAVSYFSWRLHNKGYPVTDIPRYDENCRVRWKTNSIRLHVFLLGKAPDGLEWDHRNQDKCDNRRENLRAVTNDGVKPPASAVGI